MSKGILMKSLPSKPRLKENIWHIFPETEIAYLSTVADTYEVPRSAALAFLQMRSHCTGNNDVGEIVRRSSLDPDAVEQILTSLAPSGILYDPGEGEEQVSIGAVRSTLVAVCKLWGEELTRGYIGNKFANGMLPVSALVGWLLEMYHYIKDFPEAIKHAEVRAVGPLKDLLHEYSCQETGHEEFVLRTLEGLGLSRVEVANSIPLVGTRTVSFMMRSLVELNPSAMLLIAALVEAQDFDEKLIGQFTTALEQHYNIPASVFDPYFEHQRIDVKMGHAQLLENNLDLVDIDAQPLLDRVVNELHDLKHAFDLQGLEIEQYYGDLNGRYLPRQFMSFAAVR